ncbi:MAG: hypothetical protein QW292_13705 [Candidatus Parvarchaeota archaeon]
MSDMISMPYKKGIVTIPKYSRIKVYRFKGSLKGYLDSFDNEVLTIIVPGDYREFYEGSQPRGRKIRIRREFLLGYAFYPEVSILETEDKGRSKREQKY